MQEHATPPPFDQQEPRNGVAVADGWGCRIFVHHSALTISDGRGRVQRIRRFERATHNLRRLVVLGRGYVTFEALTWLADQRIGFAHVDPGGRVLGTSALRGLNDARLRRAQALAMTSPVGVQIGRTLLAAKVAGQLDVARQLANPAAVEEIQAALDRLEGADSLNGLLAWEAAAAAAYWQAWAPIPIRWVTRDQRRVPDHWRTVGPRTSPLGGSPRLAVTPAHAVANYLLALVEVETRIACHAVGLDPALGVLHADVPGRDGFIFDLEEPVRPYVDRYLLDLLENHRFRAADFVETRRGVCRILRPLTHSLAETLPAWAAHIAPVAEQVAKMLADSEARISRIPTPLTKAHNRAANDSRRRHARKVAPGARRPPPNCTVCGQPLPPGHAYCPACRVQRQAGRFPDFHERGLDTLAQARAEGRDPAHGGQAREKRSAAMSRRNQETLVWDREHERPDPEEFRRDILPGLRDRPIRELMAATGLSHPYCAMVRRGAYTPHPRHWDRLRAVSLSGASPAGG